MTYLRTHGKFIYSPFIQFNDTYLLSCIHRKHHLIKKLKIILDGLLGSTHIIMNAICYEFIINFVEFSINDKFLQKKKVMQHNVTLLVFPTIFLIYFTDGENLA